MAQAGGRGGGAVGLTRSGVVQTRNSPAIPASKGSYVGRPGQLPPTPSGKGPAIAPSGSASAGHHNPQALPAQTPHRKPDHNNRKAHRFPNVPTPPTPTPIPDGPSSHTPGQHLAKDRLQSPPPKERTHQRSRSNTTPESNPMHTINLNPPQGASAPDNTTDAALDWRTRVADSSDAVSRGFSTLRARLATASEALADKWTTEPKVTHSVGTKKLLYGLPIEMVMEKYPPDFQLPPFIEKICLYIEQALVKQEGIFRLAGSKADIDSYKALVDAGQEVRFWEMPDHVVCDLFKLYIRSLPDCLLTEELYDCFMAKAAVAVTEKTTVDLAGLLNTIPAVNRFLLKRLLLLLKRVARYDSVNKMTIPNLALIFGPNLLQAPPGSTTILTDMPLVNQVAANLIVNCEQLFQDTALMSHYIGFVQAKSDYTKQSDNELSFSKGDILWLVGRNMGGFSKGELDGQSGYYPDNLCVPYDFEKSGKPSKNSPTVSHTPIQATPIPNAAASTPVTQRKPLPAAPQPTSVLPATPPTPARTLPAAPQPTSVLPAAPPTPARTHSPLSTSTPIPTSTSTLTPPLPTTIPPQRNPAPQSIVTSPGSGRPLPATPIPQITQDPTPSIVANRKAIFETKAH